MDAQDEDPISAGAGYLVGSLPLFVLGGISLANVNESAFVFGSGALLLFACATYLLVVGAVARGIQVARSRRT